MAKVVLGISGGIAAYKAPELVRELKRHGHDVRVVTTRAALHFVSAPALAAVSGYPVRSELFDPQGEGQIGHIEVADWPDLVVIAPATAHLMARAALGLADDLLTTILLATRAPVMWAPAMNSNMWHHETTQAHLATLRARGHAVIGPAHGELACGWIGEGKMLEPMVIAQAVDHRMQMRDGGLWAGKRVLVSAGPTRVYLDPVRFLTNASTGQMGFALAAELAKNGAQVTLVSGPVERPTPVGVERVAVETADDMHRELSTRLDAENVDAVMMVAAVADLRLGDGAPGKIDKDQLLATIAGLPWQRERDVLADLCQRHRHRTRFLGFAAQTLESADDDDVRRQLVNLGRAKLVRKGCHALFVNRVGVPGSGFASATNAGHLLLESGDVIDWSKSLDKSELARAIVVALGQAWFQVADE